MKKVMKISIYSLVTIMAFVLFLFGCIKFVLWIIEENKDYFKEDVFGNAAHELFPDVTQPPMGAEAKLQYHSELLHESYYLTFSFEQEQDFSAYRKSLEAEQVEKLNSFTMNDRLFWHIPFKAPEKHVYYTNYYIIFDQNQQTISFFLIDDEQYSFTSEEAVMEWCFAQGVLPN